MITRLEIDGFKSLRELAVDLEPLTVFIGPNSAGKSNLLDALALLSRLASMSIKEAFKQGRGRAIAMPPAPYSRTEGPSHRRTLSGGVLTRRLRKCALLGEPLAEERSNEQPERGPLDACPEAALCNQRQAC